MLGQFDFQTSSRKAIVRPAETRDVEGMARVSIDTWRLTYSGLLPAPYLARMRLSAHEAQRRRLMQGPGMAHLVAEEVATGETVGFASAGPARGQEASGELYELYVQNGFQGQGLGRRLLDGARLWLRSRGHGSMIVWVLAQNTNRIFYDRMGGRPAGVRTIRVGGALVEEAAYVWRDI